MNNKFKVFNAILLAGLLVGCNQTDDNDKNDTPKEVIEFTDKAQVDENKDATKNEIKGNEAEEKASDKEDHKEQEQTSDKTEKTDEKKEDKTDKNNTENKDEAKKEVSNDEQAIETVKEFFSSISKKDMSTLENIFTLNDELRAQYQMIFDSYDLHTNIESYEITNKDGDTYSVDVKVKFVDKSNSSDYFDNISDYEMKVDAKNNKILSFEITNTIDVN